MASDGSSNSKGQFMTWYQHFGGSQLLGELQSNALLYSSVQPAQSDLWETSTGVGALKELQGNDLHESLQQYCRSKRCKFKTTESLHSF